MKFSSQQCIAWYFDVGVINFMRVNVLHFRQPSSWLDPSRIQISSKRKSGLWFMYDRAHIIIPYQPSLVSSQLGLSLCSIVDNDIHCWCLTTIFHITPFNSIRFTCIHTWLSDCASASDWIIQSKCGYTDKLGNHVSMHAHFIYTLPLRIVYSDNFLYKH